VEETEDTITTMEEDTDRIIFKQKKPIKKKKHVERKNKNKDFEVLKKKQKKTLTKPKNLQTLFLLER